jgi:xanthine dehydrogenase molybdopterin-binding subunit B
VIIAHTPDSVSSSHLPSGSHLSSTGETKQHDTTTNIKSSSSSSRVVHDIHRVAHRQRLVVNLLIKFLDVLDNYNGNNDDSVGVGVTVAGSPSGYRRDISKGTQLLPGLIKSDVKDGNSDWYEHTPVSMPVPKLTARLSASGEAKFTADMPLPARCAYATFAQAYETGRVVVNVDMNVSLSMPGVIKILTYKDIPGINNGSCTSPERLLIEFNSDPVHYAGEPVCIVVADTDQHARNAAANIVVVYAPKPPSGLPPTATFTSTTATGGGGGGTVEPKAPTSQKNSFTSPAIHVEEAKERGMIMKRSEASAHLERHDHGFDTVDNALVSDATKKNYQIIKGVLRCGPQKHFPIETHTALAIPDEGGRMVVWSSMQYPAGVQESVARCIFKEGKEADRTFVTAKCRRVGGGFGAKLSRHTPSACAASVAAVVCRRPVLMSLDRNTDMEMTGGRHDVVGTYTFSVNTTTGKISSLKVHVLLDVGWSKDISGFCV